MSSLVSKVGYSNDIINLINDFLIGDAKYWKYVYDSTMISIKYLPRKKSKLIEMNVRIRYEWMWPNHPYPELIRAFNILQLDYDIRRGDVVHNQYEGSYKNEGRYVFDGEKLTGLYFGIEYNGYESESSVDADCDEDDSDDESSDEDRVDEYGGDTFGGGTDIVLGIIDVPLDFWYDTICHNNLIWCDFTKFQLQNRNAIARKYDHSLVRHNMICISHSNDDIIDPKHLEDEACWYSFEIHYQQKHYVLLTLTHDSRIGKCLCKSVGFRSDVIRDRDYKKLITDYCKYEDNNLIFQI